MSETTTQSPVTADVATETQAPAQKKQIPNKEKTASTGTRDYNLTIIDPNVKLGGGYSDASAAGGQAPPNRMLRERGAANPEYQKSREPNNFQSWSTAQCLAHNHRFGFPCPVILRGVPMGLWSRITW